MLFPFFLGSQMWVVAVLSDLTQMLSLSIVHRVLLWGSFAGLKREQPVYVLLSARSTVLRDKGTAPAFFFFDRMWHRFLSNRVLLQGWWGLQS